MALKTFNIDEKIYKQFSKHCKKEGISMSKKVEKFIEQEIQKISPSKSLTPKTELKIEEHPLRKYV